MQQTGAVKSTVSYHRKKLNLSIVKHKDRNKRKDWDEIKKFYEAGASYEECCAKFNTTKGSLWKAARRGVFTPRSNGSQSKSYSYFFAKHQGNRGGRGMIRNAILREELIPYLCGECGINSWRDKPLTLRLDHINGDGRDHSLENLQFICPNCDSQSPTYCWRNRGKYNAPLGEQQTRQS